MNLEPYKKMSADELKEFLRFRQRGSKVAPKKGKGSYKRRRKHKSQEEI